MSRRPRLLFACIACAFGLAAPSASAAPEVQEAGGGAAAAALTVATVTAQTLEWPLAIPANGGLSAWQEAVVAAETGGLRIVELRSDVGSRVRRGEVLARLSQDTVLAELALQQARWAQARAALSEAQSNAARARALRGSKALSQQQIQQYLVAEETAKANLAAAEAQLRGQRIRVDQTHIRAPDDGVVSARSATLGSVVQAGTELFRLVRQSRIEWRAEVMAEQLARIRPGHTAQVQLPGGEAVEGVVRMLGPTFDPNTRMALVYVDLPETGAAQAGMYAHGEIRVDTTPALTVPFSAVVLRDGHSYVFEVGADRRVRQLKVTTGRRAENRVEILGGLPADASVVESGGAFLNDGDSVRVTTTATQGAR